MRDGLRGFDRSRQGENINWSTSSRCFGGNLGGHRSNETVAAPGQCFDVSRFLRIVAERSTDLVHAKIDAMFVIDECIIAPEAVLNLLPGNDLPRMLCEQEKHPEWLWANLDRDSGFAKFA